MIEIDIVDIRDVGDLSGDKFYQAFITREGEKLRVNYMTNPDKGKPHLSVEEFTEMIKQELI